MAKIIATRHAPNRTIVRDGMTSQNAVRCYRNSPEDVMVQIRRIKEYVSVALTFDEAREFGQALIDAANE